MLYSKTISIMANEATHWRYSSARDYEGIEGLIEVERFW